MDFADRLDDVVHIRAGRQKQGLRQTDGRFTDLAVSGRHATFSRKGGTWFLRDLGSRNGTFVNGRRLTRPTRLRTR